MIEKKRYINECQSCVNCETITIMDNDYFRCIQENPLWVKCNDFVKVELPITQRK